MRREIKGCIGRRGRKRRTHAKELLIDEKGKASISIHTVLAVWMKNDMTHLIFPCICLYDRTWENSLFPLFPTKQNRQFRAPLPLLLPEKGVKTEEEGKLLSCKSSG